MVKAHRPTRILDVRLIERASGAAKSIHSLEGVLDAQAPNDQELKIDFNGDLENQAALVERLVKDGFKLIGFHEEQADLEDVFLKLTKGAVN